MIMNKQMIKFLFMFSILLFISAFHSPKESFAASLDKKEQTQIISTAKTLIGKPYKYGGVTPAGFDCSGFVNYVYKQVGVSLPRSSKDIWSAGEKLITPLSAGDLVFFKTNGFSISHVGIYIGNGNFIHSANTGVQIDGLAETYYKNTYVGAKRF